MKKRTISRPSSAAWSPSRRTPVTDRPSIDNLFPMAMPTVSLYVKIFDGVRLKLSMDPRSTIFNVRSGIYDRVRIPIDHWRLCSSGGRIFWDSRKPSDYGISDQETVTMRLLLKEGANKFKNRKSKSASAKRSSGTIQENEFRFNERVTRVSSTQIQSQTEKRLSARYKRPKLKSKTDTNFGLVNEMSIRCAICGDTFEKYDSENPESRISCSKCGRPFHFNCSGIQKG